MEEAQRHTPTRRVAEGVDFQQLEGEGQFHCLQVAQEVLDPAVVPAAGHNTGSRQRSSDIRRTRHMDRPLRRSTEHIVQHSQSAMPLCLVARALKQQENRRKRSCLAIGSNSCPDLARHRMSRDLRSDPCRHTSCCWRLRRSHLCTTPCVAEAGWL